MATLCLSSLTSKIRSVLQSQLAVSGLPSAPALRVGLRNLNVLLVCLRSSGDDEISRVIYSRFSRIEDVIGRVSTSDYCKTVFSDDILLLLQLAHDVTHLASEVHDDWDATMPNRLTLDDALEVVDCVLHNSADFWPLTKSYWYMIPNRVNLRYEIDEFEVQTRFLKDFILFIEKTGVEAQQLQILLVHIRPFVMDAARWFQIDGSFRFTDTTWVEQVRCRSTKVDPQVFQACTQTLLSNSTLDQTNDAVLKDFLCSLISLLWNLLRHNRHPHHSDSLKALYEGLRLSRFILKQQRQTNGDFEDQIGALIRDAGIVICTLYFAGVDSLYLSDLLQRFVFVQAHLPPGRNSLRANGLDFGNAISMQEISDGEVQIVTSMPSHQSNSTPQVAGFQDDEVTSMLDRLTRGSKQLRLVPISGMAGIGKTTFALEMYNIRSVMYHFHIRAWCAISQVLDKKRVLVQLLDQIEPGNYAGMIEDDLADKLRKSLKGNRYLIVLDDVWTPQVWESLKPSFPNDATQSRIVLTSRLHAIVPDAHPDEQPHFLRLRNHKECLKILEMKLLHKAKDLRTELKKFANLCKGLPLTSVIVAGLLATTAQQGWEAILERLSSGGISSMEQCKIALEFSYENLPSDLKPCFIYFGLFPEDEEIYVRKLIRLWMAEGFVATKKDQRIEDAAQEYLNNLIQRNLVIVAKRRSIGGTKTCIIHDLLHDFCMMKGKQENLFHRLRQSHDELSDFNEPCNIQRLSIHSTALHFEESKLFCPLVHSMLFFNRMENQEVCFLPDMLFIIQIYKLLKVLDTDTIWFGGEVPSKISLLIHLTYLSICCDVPIVPSSIGNLSSLETLIISLEPGIWEVVSLPHSIWNLEKLKYLHIISLLGYSGFRLPVETLESSPSLLELETICGVELDYNKGMEKQMRKFPNIRCLKCKVEDTRESLEELSVEFLSEPELPDLFSLSQNQNSVENSKELGKTFVLPKFLAELELLAINSVSGSRYHFDFGCAEKLKKVSLGGFELSREEIAVIGKLPKLEVLKLKRVSFLGGRMEMEDGEFSELRILKLRYLRNLETWTVAGEEQLPCLQKLEISECHELKEIPRSCLEFSSALEEIASSGCSSSLESLVDGIEKVQKEFGNSIRRPFVFSL